MARSGWGGKTEAIVGALGVTGSNLVLNHGENQTSLQRTQTVAGPQDQGSYDDVNLVLIS